MGSPDGSSKRNLPACRSSSHLGSRLRLSPQRCQGSGSHFLKTIATLRRSRSISTRQRLCLTFAQQVERYEPRLELDHGARPRMPSPTELISSLPCQPSPL